MKNTVMIIRSPYSKKNKT